MQPKYTPEQKEKFPSHIWVIDMKNKPSMVIDADLVKEVIDALNSSDLVFISDYRKTIHKFDIEEISIKRVKDPERDLITKLYLEKQKDIPKTPLSLKKCIECLNLQNQYLPSTETESVSA